MKKNSLSKHAAEPLLKLCYIILLNLSGENHKEITYQDISKSLFVDRDASKRIIAILENLVVEDINQGIALEGISYESLHRNPYSEPYYVPQLRLTLRETKALLRALISTGLENNDEILGRLSSYVAKNADIDEILKQNYTADHTSYYAISPWKITICCLSKQRFSFDYRRGDGTLKSYSVDPLYVMYKEGRWYMNAWDVATDQQKFFLLSKMRNLQPLGMKAENHDYKKLNSFTFTGNEKIEVTFKNGAYFDVISHSALEQINSDTSDILALHDATQPDWIAKQVAASGGLISTNCTKVNQQAKAYAKELIDKAKGV